MEDRHKDIGKKIGQWEGKQEMGGGGREGKEEEALEKIIERKQ